MQVRLFGPHEPMLAAANILNLLCFRGIADIAGLGSRSVTAAISLLHHSFVPAQVSRDPNQDRSATRYAVSGE